MLHEDCDCSIVASLVQSQVPACVRCSCGVVSCVLYGVVIVDRLQATLQGGDDALRTLQRRYFSFRKRSTFYPKNTIPIFRTPNPQNFSVQSDNHSVRKILQLFRYSSLSQARSDHKLYLSEILALSCHDRIQLQFCR